MDVITQTGIWRRTLAEMKRKAGANDSVEALRSKFRQAFVKFRDRAKVMAGEIPRDLKQLTVHDITHIDALWQIADLIVGDKYPLTPTEAFVLGGAFLLHDLGLALASYPAGMAEFEKDPVWRDAAFQLFRGKHCRSPGTKEMASLDPEIKRQACEQALRLRHAAHAEELATIGYRHTDRDQVYHLIEDEELRRAYGRLIGRIAHSHWWPSEKLPVEFDQVIGAFPGTPVEWTVDPLKLALVVRVADACHLDERRAPGFVRALRNPTGESEKHWRLQEYVQTPYEKNGRLVFSASKEIPIEDVDAWWLGYEMLSLADRELRDADAILRETDRPPFAVDAVAGANDPARLARHFPTKGWAPIPTKLQISDVPSLVRNLGGQALYGENPRVPLRELIQNARDAVVARRIKEGRDKAWGQITVRLIGSDTEQKIEVRDTGVGMSSELLVGPFLDFGTSYWNSALMLREHPGLASKGFEPQGRFGIGFFSVFMWGEHVKVITRRPEDGDASTRVLEFSKGLSGRPVLRRADFLERLIEPGTVVQVWLDGLAGDPGGILAPGPIESWFNRLPGMVRRDKAWSLRDLCAWLCPAIDVNLVIEENEKQETSASASDWETMAGTDLLRRLLLHRDDLDSVCTDNLFQRAAANVRDIRDEDGRLLGRAALKHFMHSATGTQDILNQASAITAGSFRAHEQIEMVGVLLGRPERISRMRARPIALDSPGALATWATNQANLVPRLTEDVGLLTQYTMTIRMLAGDTRDLPIARSGAGFLSFEDIANSRDLPNEILLYEEFWRGSGFVQQNLPENGLAVGSGRMKALLYPLPEDDPRRRADHPRWRQYWMSLWGATIEAIARAWGVPLLEVLEASEISSNRTEDEQGGGFPQVMPMKVDIIRNPRASKTLKV